MVHLCEFLEISTMCVQNQLCYKVAAAVVAEAALLSPTAMIHGLLTHNAAFCPFLVWSGVLCHFSLKFLIFYD